MTEPKWRQQDWTNLARHALQGLNGNIFPLNAIATISIVLQLADSFTCNSLCYGLHSHCPGFHELIGKD